MDLIRIEVSIDTGWNGRNIPEAIVWICCGFSCSKKGGGAVSEISPF
jgi:hypothetical protein